MTKVKFLQLVAGVSLLLCPATGPAAAATDHTYVSGKGSDSGGCTYPAVACRTFAYAIAQTSAAGEIIVIDPADYSPVTITKSISIVADGAGPAGIALAAGNAITINAGANDVVNLRGLTLEGEGSASNGILLEAAGALTIFDCFARHFTTGGIFVGGTATVSILNSVMNDNNGNGLIVSGQGEAKTFVTIRDAVANNNGIGFYVSGATVTFAGSMATGNSLYGIDINLCCGDVGRETQVFSYGDNEISGNGTNLFGTVTPVAKQ